MGSRDDMAASSKSEDLAGDNIRLLCSRDGKILPSTRTSDGHLLRYVGGDTRLVSVSRSISFHDLMKKLENLFGVTSMMLKFKLPTLDLDVLVSVTCDEDLHNVVEEYDRYNGCRSRSRLRGFLFPLKPSLVAENQAPKQIYSNRLAQNSARNSAKEFKIDHAAVQKYADNQNASIPYASQSFKIVFADSDSVHSTDMEQSYESYQKNQP